MIVYQGSDYCHKTLRFRRSELDQLVQDSLLIMVLPFQTDRICEMIDT
jgi:hypothetical protein